MYLFFTKRRQRRQHRQHIERTNDDCYDRGCPLFCFIHRCPIYVGCTGHAESGRQIVPRQHLSHTVLVVQNLFLNFKLRKQSYADGQDRKPINTKLYVVLFVNGHQDHLFSWVCLGLGAVWGTVGQHDLGQSQLTMSTSTSMLMAHILKLLFPAVLVFGNHETARLYGVYELRWWPKAATVCMCHITLPKPCLTNMACLWHACKMRHNTFFGGLFLLFLLPISCLVLGGLRSTVQVRGNGVCRVPERVSDKRWSPKKAPKLNQTGMCCGYKGKGEYVAQDVRRRKQRWTQRKKQKSNLRDTQNVARERVVFVSSTATHMYANCNARHNAPTTKRPQPEAFVNMSRSKRSSGTEKQIQARKKPRP